MPGTKRVINIGTNPDDGTGDLLRTAFDKINQNFDDVWSYTAVNSNLDITGDSINGTTDVIINPADGSAFKVTGDTIINPDGGNYNFTINGDLANNVLYVQASTGRIGVHNTSPTVDFDVTGDVKISGMTTANNLTVTGNTVLGNANTDTVTYNAKAASNFLPFSTTQDIGAPSNRWGNVYTTNLDVSGSISGTFTGSMTSTLTGDVNNTNVTTVNLAATGPSNLHDVNITGNLVVQGTTTTLETTDVLVNNQLTFEGATADAHETILTVTDPTQDNTITFKNASGTVAFLTDVPTIINDLNDVDTSTVAPTNGQALVWNNADLEWQPGTVTGTGIAYTDLSVTTNPVGTASLIYNSTNGEFTYTPPDLSSYLTSVPAQSFASLTGKPTTIAGYGITDAFDGDYNSLTNQPTIPSAYTNSDVDTHLNQSNPTSGYVLSWNGTDYAWVAQSGGITNTDSLAEGSTNLYYTDARFDARLQTRNISNLADVDTTGASDGQALAWSSSNSQWEPLTISGSSYGDSDVATYLNGNLDSHIIPDTNSTYDIGSAQYKIRHMYLSQNSLKFVDGTNTEFSLGVNATGNKLEYNNETVSTSSYETNDSTGAIDVTKRHHFISGGINYTLADGTYIGQELYFWRSGTGTGYSDITIANVKWTVTGTQTTEARTNFVWRTEGDGQADDRTFMAVWDGAGWCLSGGRIAT